MLVGDVVIVEERLTVVDPLSLPLGVCEAVGDDVLVQLPVSELVPLTVALIVDVDESVPESLPDLDGPAPFVTNAVGERETDFENELVEVGVCDAVLVPLSVDEPVPLTDALIVDVDESVPESLPLNDGPAPLVTDAVGECEIDLDKLIVVVGDELDVGVIVAVPLPVDVPLEVMVNDIEIESVPLMLAPRVGDDD